MKILNQEKGEGYLKIQVENQDDLWYLKDIVAKGDKVRKFTQRTKLDGREKKSCKLTIEVEKTEYENERLRITGKITEAVDDVELGYHTFNVTPEDDFEIWKAFTQEEWKRVQELEDKRSYKVLFCLVDKGSADFFMVEESGISDLSRLEESIPGKMYMDQKTGEEFHKKVVSVIKRVSEEVDAIILCGPGFQKQKVKNILPEELETKVFVEDTSVTGKTGLNEAIKRGALKKVVESSRIDEETEIVEEFLEELQKEGKAAYATQVDDFIEQGAVKKLILTSKINRENPELAKKVERMGGEVHIIHTDHEAGKRLENFSGKAAILRYKPV